MARPVRSHAWLGTVAAAAVVSACSSAGSGGGGAAGAGTGGTAGGSGGTAAAAGGGAAAGSGGAGATAGSAGAAGSGGTAGTGSTGGSAGTGGSSGSEICNNEQEDDADGFADCDDPDCFADSGCIDGDLAALQMAGFVPCGKPVTFGSADSDATCQKYALGWSPQFESKCQFASYSGTVSFYCSPKPKTAVGLRWVVHGHVPTETVNGKKLFWETLSGEYAFGSSGGSGMNPLHNFFDIHSSDREEDFVGYDTLSLSLSTKGTYTHWFALWDLSSAQKPQISGGFAVLIDAAQLFPTN